MKKRFLSLALALVMVVTVGLSGCGKKADDSKDATSGTATVTEAAKDEVAATEAPKAADLEPVELNWYLPAAPQKDTELVEEALNEYLKDKINATIKLNFIDWGTWNDKYPVLLASGDDVDIMFTAGWSGFAQNVAKGYFLDITDLLPQYAPNTAAMLPEALTAAATLDGKLYSVPTSKELAHTNGFAYSTELAEKFGVTEELKAFETNMPTFADLEPILQKVHEQDPTIDCLTPGGNYAKMFCDFDPVGNENIPGMLDPNADGYTVFNEYESPEYMELYKLMHKYYEAGYVRKDAATLTSNDILAGKKSQTIFLCTGTTKPLANEEVGASYGYEMAQFSVTVPRATMNDTQGSMNAIVTTSKNPERALMFLELVNTDPYVNNVLNYGVENVHWVQAGDNVVDFAQGLDAATTGYNPNAFWEFGNQFLNYFRVGQNTAKWDLFKAYNDSSIPSKILGFNFDAEPVQTEISAVSNVLSEMKAGIYSGVLDPEEALPELNKKMKSAGLDKIIAEKQRQIDEWVAANK